MSPLIAPVADPAPPAHLRSLRVTLADGAQTTVHVAAHQLASTRVRVVRLTRPEQLASWCARTGTEEAIVGGFFVRPHGRPLGEVRTHGIARESTPFLAPWHKIRASLHVDRGSVAIGPRDSFCTAPRGDLLQAGPLLVHHGKPAVHAGTDPEGFSAGAEQFDSDISDGRHPRAAIALAGETLLAVACDGRADDEAGLTLDELAATLVDLGAQQAMNLDGGGSTSLVCGGTLRNIPRGNYDTVVPGGRSISTAIAFAPR
ncbi:phosphodiester glycosidase family protein [Conexibacter sp. JD483]|uniref:phosphodiester glycosidase family protein n=1 Tax=unclassified Conexibacter TaxID=2627773 RepID=UPI00271FCFB6|nr:MULTISPECIES: phosphodiester glycosidase family protein [unclassified Conexibacter]MDO8188871.1 phosphodiester glycosidase family protein [Conexibacter sp. CPCC 205706]MDO8200449.1 phosphodiester glycosidase family protein [Conexibacter sp. CPCC 205762]MDR9372592.1 phosphodiester glycosidase family protein [Conexibacter sp. JD483]